MYLGKDKAAASESGHGNIIKDFIADKGYCTVESGIYMSGCRTVKNAKNAGFAREPMPRDQWLVSQCLTLLLLECFP